MAKPLSSKRQRQLATYGLDAAQYRVFCTVLGRLPQPEMQGLGWLSVQIICEKSWGEYVRCTPPRLAYDGIHMSDALGRPASNMHRNGVYRST